MTRNSTSQIHTSTDNAPGASLARRLFWFALLLMHGAAVPSLLQILRQGGEFATVLPVGARVAAMTFSAAFFALKVLDVRWLRLCPGWRSVVAAIVVVALLHVGVIDRAIGGEFSLDPAHLGLVFFLGSLGHTDLLARLANHVLGLLTPPRLRRARRDRWFTRACEVCFRPYELSFIPSFTGPRAPPAR